MADISERNIPPSSNLESLIADLEADCAWLDHSGIDYVGVIRNVQRAIRLLSAERSAAETAVNLPYHVLCSRCNATASAIHPPTLYCLRADCPGSSAEKATGE